MDFNVWLHSETIITTSYRAAAAWNRILQKPTSVTFRTRAGATLAVQTVRIEYDNRATEAQSEAGKAPVRKLTIFGVRGHNDIADTDMSEGYRFILDGDEYRVIDTMATIGEIQATCEAVG